MYNNKYVNAKMLFNLLLLKIFFFLCLFQVLLNKNIWSLSNNCRNLTVSSKLRSGAAETTTTDIPVPPPLTVITEDEMMMKTMGRIILYY